MSIKYIENQKVIIAINYYTVAQKYYPIYDHDTSGIRTLDHFARKRYVRAGVIDSLKYTAIKISISLKRRSLYKKSIGISEICRIIESASTEEIKWKNHCRMEQDQTTANSE